VIWSHDCLISDHHFDCEFRRIVKSKEINLQKKNFLPQVTKTRKVELTKDEKDYHSAHVGRHFLLNQKRKTWIFQ
jgi:hypothetical protein